MSLTGKRIAVLRGSNTAEKMQLLSNITLYPVDSVEQMLKMVESGRVDLAFYQSLALRYYLKYLGRREHLELVKNSYSSKKHYMVLSKRVSLLTRNKINSALADMVNDGTLAKILSFY